MHKCLWVSVRSFLANLLNTLYSSNSMLQLRCHIVWVREVKPHAVHLLVSENTLNNSRNGINSRKDPRVALYNATHHCQSGSGSSSNKQQAALIACKWAPALRKCVKSLHLLFATCDWWKCMTSGIFQLFLYFAGNFRMRQNATCGSISLWVALNEGYIKLDLDNGLIVMNYLSKSYVECHWKYKKRKIRGFWTSNC